jgi:hypothetical protein
MKRSPEAFVAATKDRYLWSMLSDYGERMVGGRCRICHSDLAVTVSVLVPEARVRELFDIQPVKAAA